MNVFEYVLGWRGHKAKLRQEMRRAKSYDEWKGGAKKLDGVLGFDEWKEADDDPYFDYILVRHLMARHLALPPSNDAPRRGAFS